MFLILGIISLCWWRKNIIMILLSMELLLLSMYTLLIQSNLLTSPTHLLIILTLMASGSSLGLSLLVSNSRLSKTLSSSSIWTLI